MKRVIHHIRKQPEHVKRHILHIMIVICAVVLFSFWIFSLGKTFSDSGAQLQMKQDLKPFSLIKDNITQQIQ